MACIQQYISMQAVHNMYMYMYKRNKLLLYAVLDNWVIGFRPLGLVSCLTLDVKVSDDSLEMDATEVG